MEVLYTKYINIQKFITEYRNYTIEDKFYDFAEFKKIIQIEQYILHKCTNVKKGRFVYIYIFRDQSKYVKTTPQFKRLMDKLPDDPSDIIIISKNALSVYINKALAKYTHLRIFNYMHQYFSMELTLGPLCSKHTILTNNEVRELCARDLVIHPLSLPSISINDPQNIWIGGELGEIIKIESISEITGKTIRYRIVSPDSGKMINIQKLSKRLEDNELENLKIVSKNIDDVKETVDVSEYIDDDDEDDDDDDDDVN
jgi:DNA-directed RNA polymerase subunit H (RpoH/RPB5)